jgi:hypothetical protein
MPAMLDVVAVVGPGDPCQYASISYSLVLTDLCKFKTQDQPNGSSQRRCRLSSCQDESTGEC